VRVARVGSLYPNPLSDSSFARSVSATRLYTDPLNAAAGHVDLLTAIEHEMGHRLGLDDSYAEQDRDNIMYGYLTGWRAKTAGARPGFRHTNFRKIVDAFSVAGIRSGQQSAGQRSL